MLLSIDQRTMIYSIFGFSKGGLKTKSESWICDIAKSA